MINFHEVKGIVSDLDGVFFFGADIHKDARSFIDAVRERGWKLMFASNGANGRGAAVEKFKKKGITVQEEDVMTAGYATAKYLAAEQARLKDEFCLLLLGAPELRAECETEGVHTFLSQDDVWHPDRQKWIADRTPTHVVVSRHNFNARTVEAGVAAVRRGAKWIASGVDHAVTTEDGDLRLGTGSLTAAMQSMLSTTKGLSETFPYILGKPNPSFIQACLDRMGLKPHQAAMLGDSFDTDIAVARRIGMMPWLVLSGVTDRDLAERKYTSPDHIFSDIGELAQKIRSGKF